MLDRAARKQLYVPDTNVIALLIERDSLRFIQMGETDLAFTMVLGRFGKTTGP